MSAIQMIESAADYVAAISPAVITAFYEYLDDRISVKKPAVYSKYTLDHRLRIYRGPLAPYISDIGQPTVHELELHDGSRFAVVLYPEDIVLVYLYRPAITEDISIVSGENTIDAVVIVDPLYSRPILTSVPLLYME